MRGRSRWLAGRAAALGAALLVLGLVVEVGRLALPKPGHAGTPAAQAAPTPGADDMARRVAAWASPTRVWAHEVPYAEQELVTVAWSPDSRRLAILSDTSRHIQILDRADGRTVDQIRARWYIGHPIVFIDGGRSLLSPRWPEDGANPFTDVLTVMATDPLRITRTVKGPQPKTGTASFIALSREGKTVATYAFGGEGDGVAVFDVASWRPLAFFSGRTNKLFVLSLAVTPDGKRVVIGGNGDLRVCDVSTGVCGPPQKISSAEVRFVRFSEDGKTLVVGLGDPASDMTATLEHIKQERDHMLRILDFPSLAETTRVRGIVRQQVNALDVHPSLPLIAAASGDGLQLISADTGETIGKIRTEWGARRITSAAFSPDGECLAIGFNSNVSVYCTPEA